MPNQKPSSCKGFGLFAGQSDIIRKIGSRTLVMTTNQPDRLSRIEELVQKNAEAISRLEQKVDKLETQFFQLSRDNLSIARTIIITAGTVTILSPLLQALSPAIETLVNRFVH